ncbi:hypothetical protein [Chlorogloea sp. CCALA 695]|nr:hypothetical protein [Chlorogloea sp. CCALA 695]
MASDPTKLDDLEMHSLLAHGLIPYMERVAVATRNHNHPDPKSSRF